MDNPIRVLIVDDSAVFRSQIRAALEGHPAIEVVGFATDGKMACEALKTKRADVVTLDLEMPVMNGLETLRELKKLGLSPYVVVISALSKSGAEATLKALEAGASDFLLKPQSLPGDSRTPAEIIRDALLPKILSAKEGVRRETLGRDPVVPLATKPATERFGRFHWGSFNPEVVVIASSTGGPAALEKLFGFLRGPLTCPVLIAQHMPPFFTATLAERLAKISNLPVTEAKHLEKVVRGHVYIAPGDYHMRVRDRDGELVIYLDQEPLRNSVRPAADFLFESAVRCTKNATLGIVLTGMGADGKDGAVAIKNNSGAVLIQDKETCVVFGMPGAVHAEGAFDEMLTLEQISQKLQQLSISASPEELRYAK